MAANTTPSAVNLTRKGKATRDRIVTAAAEIMFDRGVAGTCLDSVKATADVSSSQLYHYFADKQALVLAVGEYQTEEILRGQEPLLANLDGIPALQAWRDRIVDHHRRLSCRGGCPIGALGSELADNDLRAREKIAVGFRRWEASIRRGLRVMHSRGELTKGTAPDDLALATLAALQGGLLLAKIYRQVGPLETALDTMIEHIRSLTTQPRKPKRKRVEAKRR
jgi:TetR/AcrR family transcriptional regulator, transcriptional repressor for nem operon